MRESPSKELIPVIAFRSPENFAGSSLSPSISSTAQKSAAIMHALDDPVMRVRMYACDEGAYVCV